MALLGLMVGAVLAGGVFGVRFQRIEKEARLTQREESESEAFGMEGSVVSQETARSDSSEDKS